MILRILGLVAVAFMAFGGSASALSVSPVKVWDGVACTSQPQGGTLLSASFDLQVVPGDKGVPGLLYSSIFLSSDTGGNRLAGIRGAIGIIVQHADGSKAEFGILRDPFVAGCPGSSTGAEDVTHLFALGPNAVKATLYSINGYGSSGFLYLVAKSGVVLSVAQ